jgi:hypothetical protein
VARHLEGWMKVTGVIVYDRKTPKKTRTKKKKKPKTKTKENM